MLTAKSDSYFAELKQINEDLKDYLIKTLEKSQYHDFTPTFQDYIDQVKRLDLLDSESTDNDGEQEAPPEPNLDKFEETGYKVAIRCKLYQRVNKKTGSEPTVEVLGIGTFYVKPTESESKLQVIFRQDPDLRKVLLNEIVTPKIPIRALPKAVQLAFWNESGQTRIYIAKAGSEQDANQLRDCLTFKNTEQQQQ